MISEKIVQRISGGLRYRQDLVVNSILKLGYYFPSLVVKSNPELRPGQCINAKFSLDGRRTDILESAPEKDLSALRASCDRLISQDWSEFIPGQIKFKSDGAVDWHHDLTGGPNWPLRHGYQMDYSSEERPGDIRLLWELHRHHSFSILALGYYLFQEPTYVDMLKLQWYSWREMNPMFRGVAWIGSQIQENAIRNMSWIWTFLFLSTNSHESQFIIDLQRAIYEQGRFIHYFFKENKPISHNHLISEAAGLAVTGFFFSDHVFGRKWLNLGMRTLEKAIDFQVHDDGVQGEFSINYHAFVLESALQTLVFARWSGHRCSEKFENHVHKMIRHMADMTYPDGTIPSFGDTDSATSYALFPDRLHHRERIIATGAVLFEDSEVASLSRGVNIETLILVDPMKVKSVNLLKSTRSGICYQRTYPSMNTIISESWDELQEKLIVRGGGSSFPRGIGTSHNHADFLGFTYWANGREWIVDPATYLYSYKDDWRYYFRSTKAHNTIAIDDHDILDVRTTRFGIPSIFPVETLRIDREDWYALIQLRYQKPGPVPWLHTRMLVHIYPGGIFIRDRIKCAGRHELHQYFQVAAKLELRFEANHVTLEDLADPELKLHFPGVHDDIDVLWGSENPIGGWNSTRYGAKEPISSIRRSVNFTDEIQLDSMILYDWTKDFQRDGDLSRFLNGIAEIQYDHEKVTRLGRLQNEEINIEL